MDIAQSFAGNEGTMGGIGGAVGGFMMGGAFGGSVSDLARNALNPDRVPAQNPPKDLRNIQSPIDDRSPKPFDVAGFMSGVTDEGPARTKPANPSCEPETAPAGNSMFCANCGNDLLPDMLFCPKCGTRQAKECPNCHTRLIPDAAFCHKCGTPC